MRDWPLYAKGLIVIAVPVIGLLALTIAFYAVHLDEREAQRWVSRTLEVRSQVQLIHNHLEEAESSVLGYLMTRDPEWLKSFQSSRRSIPEALDRLESMVSDNSDQVARVQRLKQLMIDRLSGLSSLPARIPEGTRATAHPALAQSRQNLEEIRAQINGILDQENQFLERRTAQASRVSRSGFVVIAGGLLLVPLGAILGMLLFTSAISRRIEVLQENARRLARGLPVSLTPSGSDEIGRLEQSLFEAGTLLADRERQLRHVADGLEARVAERTADLAAANRALQGEIEERSRTEAQLAEANNRLRVVIDSSPLAIIRLDLDGRVLSWSCGAERIYGWSEPEVLGKPLPTVPDQRMDFFHEALAGAARGETLTGVQSICQRKDGTTIDSRVWTAPLADAQGHIREIMAIFEDFSGQRKLEEQFAQSQKMEAIGRLAGGVAHDFNNVITVVSGYGQMVLEGVGEDPVLREAAGEILKAADRAAALSGQLLTFSRRQSIQPRVIELPALVLNIERMLGRVIGEDIELKTILQTGTAPVRVDPGQMEQVLMNLAVNARDAMPHGGKLTIETANVYLDESYAREHAGIQAGPYVMLAVSDTGNGMDAETRRHLFEPFFTTKDRGKGTGLGLSTVYGIVKQHGGDIWVYSELDKGTVFKVYLPQVIAAAVAASAEGTKAAATLGTETVLVVEDEAVVRRLVCDILNVHGYTVLEAESGAKALEISQAHESKIDLLVTDVVMPKMNGRDLAEAMVLLLPEVKVLFLSGYTDQVVIEHGVLDAGAEFLQKPFSPETLAQKVRAVLDRRATA